MIFIAFLISTSFAASKGPGICEALGVCALPHLGAYPRTDTDVSRFSPNDNLAWVVDGCDTRGAEVLDPYLENIDNATSWLAAGYYTMCCSDDDDTCYSPSTNSRPNGVSNREETSYCNNGKSFQDAKRYCESYGRRLCTKPELQSGRCCVDGVGCNPRNRRFWTEDAYIPFYGCPKGMDKVTPPVRHEGYRVYADSDKYTPGEALTITVEVLDKTKKYLGLMIYAVVNDADSYGPSGCPLHESGVPTRGCDGYAETKVGTWEVNESPDWQIGGCPEILTHSHAALKKYYEKFTWIAPDAGFGSVIFRVLIKHGSTNGGMFYWPMLEDLVVEEGPPPSNETAVWHTGSISQSCNTICGNLGKACSMDQESFTKLDGYEMMKRSPEATCQMPLLSSCQQQSPTKDSETGHCWLSNPASTQCDEPMSYVACCGSGSAECGSSMTLADAREYCSSRGKQICSRAELRDCSMNCQTDDRQYWTSDEVTECVSPLEKICEDCDCTIGFTALGFSYDTALECAHAVLEAGRDNGEHYAGMMLNERNNGCWACTEEKILTGRGTTGNNQLYALTAPLATPAEEICQSCKCGGESDDDVRNVQSIIDCQQEATKKGYDYFSYRADNGLCHPANALTCATEESRSNNGNFNSYFVANFSCSTRVWVSRNCGEEELIDLPPSVGRSNVETTQAQVVDICDSTSSEGGNERLCQCTGEGHAPKSNSDNDSTTVGVAVGVTCAVLFCCCLGFIYYFFFSENLMKDQIGGSNLKEDHDFGHSLQIQKLPPTQSLEGAPSPPPGRPTAGAKRTVGGRNLPNRPPPPPPKRIENRF